MSGRTFSVGTVFPVVSGARERKLTSIALPCQKRRAHLAVILLADTVATVQLL